LRWFLLADKMKNSLKNQAHAKKCLAEAVSALIVPTSIHENTK